MQDCWQSLREGGDQLVSEVRGALCIGVGWGNDYMQSVGGLLGHFAVMKDFGNVTEALSIDWWPLVSAAHRYGLVN